MKEVAHAVIVMLAVLYFLSVYLLGDIVRLDDLHKRNVWMQGDAVMEVGDDVTVEVLGELQPRVARLEALWSERPVDNCERMLARCRLYYRPSVSPRDPPWPS